MANFDLLSSDTPAPRAAQPPAEPPVEPDDAYAEQRLSAAVKKIADNVAAKPIRTVFALELSADEAAASGTVQAAVAHLLAQRGHAVCLSVVPTANGGEHHRMWLVDRDEHVASFLPATGQRASGLVIP